MNVKNIPISINIFGLVNGVCKYLKKRSESKEQASVREWYRRRRRIEEPPRTIDNGYESNAKGNMAANDTGTEKEIH
jgi:hypothetical protein